MNTSLARARRVSLQDCPVPEFEAAARRVAAYPVAGSTAIISWKRLLDITLILLALPVILPVMGLVTLWIKLVSRGPAIFRQTRIGRDGRPFTLYKFRTMRVNAETASHVRHFGNLVENNRPMVKMDLVCDPRLVPGGCLLRAAGIDELPQLFNILRGEMSLVGPRPCLPEEYRYFTRIQRVRFMALPGLTGIWQSQGKNLATFNDMNAMDASYVRHASPLLDLKIICQTPRAVFAQVRLAYLRHRSSKRVVTPRLPTVDGKTLDGLSTQRLG